MFHHPKKLSRELTGRDPISHRHNLFTFPSRQFAMDEKNERFIKQLWIPATIETLCVRMTRMLCWKIKTFSYIFISERKFIESCSNYDSNETIRHKVQYTNWWWSITGKSLENPRKVLGINSDLGVTKINLFDFSSVIFSIPANDLKVERAQLNLNKIWHSSDKHGNGIKV
jgi:hypothetical protein